MKDELDCFFHRCIVCHKLCMFEVGTPEEGLICNDCIRAKSPPQNEVKHG